MGPWLSDVARTTCGCFGMNICESSASSLYLLLLSTINTKERSFISSSNFADSCASFDRTKSKKSSKSISKSIQQSILFNLREVVSTTVRRENEPIEKELFS